MPRIPKRPRGGEGETVRIDPLLLAVAQQLRLREAWQQGHDAAMTGARKCSPYKPVKGVKHKPDVTGVTRVQLRAAWATGYAAGKTRP